MMKRLPNLIAIMTTTVISFTASAAWSASPYSSNGIGTLIPASSGISVGMGGAGMALPGSSNMTRSNPAQLATINQHVYALGFTHRYNNFNGEQYDFPPIAETDPELFKLVFPIFGDMAFSWGLSPFSRTDSNISMSGDGYTDVINASGGLNVSTTALAMTVRDIVRFGVSLDYIFGSINEDWERLFPEESNYQDTTNYIKKKYKGYAGTAGVLVSLPYRTTFGVAYTRKAELDMTIRVRPADRSNPEVEYTSATRYLPQQFQFGLSSILSERLTAAMDMTIASWKDAAETDTEKLMYDDTWSFGGGVRFVPSTSITASYLEKIPVSAGFRMGTLYYKSYPVVDTVFEWALTAGIEFPFLENRGRLITSLEAGKRGDKGSNGWEETFMNANILLVGAIK